MTGEDRVALPVITMFGGRPRLWRQESGTDDGKPGSATCVRQEAEVANAAEPFRQHVEQESTNELVGIERHDLGSVFVAIVPPTEADASVCAGD